MTHGFTNTERLKAAWAKTVFRESGRSQSTARAMHYFALDRKDFPLFNKARQKGIRPYKSSDDANITEWIALAKRQGLIDWDALPDETVSEYGAMEFLPQRSDFSYQYSNSFDYFSLYYLRDHLKRRTFECHCTNIERDQPYHLELWVEKNTMNSILRPVCSSYNAGLVTFKGQCSWGSVWNLCKRAAKDPRPTIVFYLSDLDVYGFLMALQMAKKVAEINKNKFAGRLDIRVKRIGLTPGQVEEYRIPLVDCESKKNKNQEKVANQDHYDAYVSPFGFDHTQKAELDALERYFRGGVAEFAASWLAKFYDSTLASRCQEITTDLVAEMPNTPELPSEVIALRSKLLAGLEELIQAEQQIKAPVGGSERIDIEPITEDPDQELWLLNTIDDIYPQPGDVDFASRVVS